LEGVVYVGRSAVFRLRVSVWLRSRATGRGLGAIAVGMIADRCSTVVEKPFEGGELSLAVFAGLGLGALGRVGVLQLSGR
jgi:hypothetical protein